MSILKHSFPQWATVSAQITANHKGYFEFRLCAQNRTEVPASESCMNRWCFIFFLPCSERWSMQWLKFAKACFGGTWRGHPLYASFRHRSLDKNVCLQKCDLLQLLLILCHCVSSLLNHSNMCPPLGIFAKSKQHDIKSTMNLCSIKVMGKIHQIKAMC